MVLEGKGQNIANVLVTTKKSPLLQKAYFQYFLYEENTYMYRGTSPVYQPSSITSQSTSCSETN